MTRRQPRRPPLRSLYVWHRWLGLAAAALTLVLALTGIALNHTEALRLDERHVRSPALLALYGIEAPPVSAACAAGGRWVLQVGRRLYLGTRALVRRAGPLRGAVPWEGMLVVAAGGELLLVTPEGRLAERMGGEAGVPAGLRRIGRMADGRIVALGAHGVYVADRELLAWRPAPEGMEATWSRCESDPPPALAQEVRAAYRATILPWERVLLDLHSGRIAGRLGPWVMDAAALLLVFLASSGPWLWWRQRRKRRAHRRRAAGAR